MCEKKKHNVCNFRPLSPPQHLALEALFVNQNFSQQILLKGGETLRHAAPNPFASGDDEEAPVASVGYRYRRWTLGGDVTLVAV